VGENMKNLIIASIIILLLVIWALTPKGGESRPMDNKKIETKEAKKAINFDGKYKNKYGAICEIKGNRALFYASKTDLKTGSFIEDNFIESNLAGDGQAKTLKFRYIDDTGGYTIVISEHDLKITYENPEENDLIANQYKKI